MHFTYEPKGVCSRKLDFDIEDGKVKNIVFVGGCNGNLKGLSALAEGMPVEEAVQKLNGITCGPKQTSCPDQLATALKQCLNQ